MTNNQLTTGLIQELYSTAVSCEVAERAGAYMASFDLLCKADDTGGIAHLVRKLIDELRADRAELQERRKAAMGSEPVIVVGDDGGDALSYRRLIQSFEPGTKLYRHAQQPTPERDQVRREHAEWSQATFGDVGPIGPLKHLSKEALEAAAEPGDLSEWADMQFLLWDAQRRAGITDEQITQAMIEKLAVNKQREWPEPKDGEPRLHIKEQPAPVVPDGYVMVPKEPTEDMRDAYYESSVAPISRLSICGYQAMLAAAPQSPGSEPATAPGKWIPVSERMPEDSGRYWCYVEEQNDLGKSHYQWNCSWNGDRWWVESEGGGIVTHWMPLPDAPQEKKP